MLADKAPDRALGLRGHRAAARRRRRGCRAPAATRCWSSHPSDDTLVTIERRPAGDAGEGEPERAVVTGLGLDVVFPVLHGPFGEDGTVQGLLELGAVPYVGSGVLASAAGMDKAAMKALFAARGLPQTPYEVADALRVDSATPRRPRPGCSALGLPLFVKPANLGSSVGISKVKTRRRARRRPRRRPSSSTARPSSRRPCPSAREIECAVLGNDEPEASVPGEVIPVAGVLRLRGEVPRRRLADDHPRRSRRRRPSPACSTSSLEAFRAIDGAGMSRVDFLLSRTHRRARAERDQHDSRLHDDQHVRQAVGGERRRLRHADRSAHRARARAAHARKQQLRTSAF